MVGSHIFLLSAIAITLTLVQDTCALSVVLQKMEPYCFGAQVQRNFEVRTSYVVSGLNED